MTLGKCMLGGPAWRAWPLSLLAAAAPAIAWRARRGPLRAEDRALLVTGAALLAAGALAPLHIPGWDFFSVRFLPLATCALVAALPFERLAARGSRAAAASALAAFAFASTGWAAAYHRELAQRAEDALAGLDAGLVRRGLRIPIVLDPYLGRPLADADAPMPYAAPLLNLGKLYATAQGGMVPWAFTSDPAIHNVLLREERRRWLSADADPRYAIDLFDPRHADDPALREAVTVYLAAHAARTEDVILWGRPEDAEHLVWLGFEPDFRRGGLVVARFAGCPLAVHVHAHEGLGDDATLTLGWYPAWGITHRYPLRRAERDADGGFRLLMRQSCGAVWIGFDAPGLACEGADAEGRLVVPSTRETPEVDCRVRAASRTARH